MKEIQRFMDYVFNWRVKTFGGKNVRADAIKLKEEAGELLDAIQSDHSCDKDIHMEIADCFILILNVASSSGLSFNKLLGLAQDKMLINEHRNWNFKGDGTAQHTEADVNKLPF